ncbi:MAG TPA: AfsR/SARP family transcriptional regulator [Actinophytocola sp.]|uniref:AfsR/SARP family transcriptional regulator n=1 Tax=Actinophytocola sp. TaxID=1872138 RepID=UPI002DDD8C42|nr:AfsR/SARP family transcriptional regulator [Actinophytocola sp.]HEV2781531.1 AfsR/SARP family transcriptional regulator [Actinophytocola sp.]
MLAEIRILGPLEVSIAGRSVVPTASKPRQVLAMLAINAGSVVTNAALMEEIWGNRPPRSAAATLQTYMLQLRRKLRDALADESGTSSKDILVTKQTGYLLNVPPDAIDAVRYDKLAATGRNAAAAGDYPTAGKIITKALGMWRGPALVDITAGSQLEIEAMRLEEIRLADVTLRIDADLYLGKHHQLLGELAALCARHPFMENFCAQHMLALYRSDQQGRALEVYHSMRVTMSEQLGVDPSPRLRQLYQLMLNSDPAVDDTKFVINAWSPPTLAG